MAFDGAIEAAASFDVTGLSFGSKVVHFSSLITAQSRSICKVCNAVRYSILPALLNCFLSLDCSSGDNLISCRLKMVKKASSLTLPVFSESDL